MGNIGAFLLIFGAVALLFSAALSLGTILVWISGIMLALGGMMLLENTEFGGWLPHGLIMLIVGGIVSYGLTCLACCF